MHYVQHQLQTVIHTRKLVYQLRAKSIKPITTITGTFQMTNSQSQTNKQLIDLHFDKLINAYTTTPIASHQLSHLHD